VTTPPPGYTPPGSPSEAWRPPPYPVAAPRPRTNGFAVASLVLGLMFCLVVTSPLAVVFGHLGLEQIEDSGGTQGGRGIATAGLVLGWIGMGLIFVLVLAFFVYSLTVA